MGQAAQGSPLPRRSRARYRFRVKDINVGVALEHKGVELIQPCIEAAADLFAYGADPEFCRYITTKPFRDVGEAESFIRSMIAANQRGERLYFLIRVNGKVVGTIGLIFTWGRDNPTVEVGYGVSREYWGRGVFARAFAILVGIARSRGKTKLVAMTTIENERSWRAVMRQGFKRQPSHQNGIVRYELQITGS
jgi:RimJ/RimL family protein N-acetyltransferase